MQRFIYKQKNKIMILSFILIVTGFIARFAFDDMEVFNITFIAASIIGVIPIALSAYQALRVKVLSIDFLVTIAVIGAFLIKAYEESAIVTFLFLFGSYLEVRTLNKTRESIKSLTEMAPEKALLKTGNDTYEEVDIDFVDVGDLLLVKTGDKVPVDGIIISGSGYLNEASMTGEADLVEKEVGNSVFAGTILDNGTLTIKTLKVGEDTLFGKIIELVEEAQDSKSKMEKFIDKFANYYTPLVLLIGIIVFIVTKDVSLAVTILVLGCPGALVIGVPVSNVAGIGNGAKNGILLKGSEVISDLSKTDTIIFDKTGTLTTGNPSVVDVKYFSNNKTKVNKYLVAIEKLSTHPIGNAIVNHFDLNTNLEVKESMSIKGGGLKGIINNEQVLVGNEQLMKENKIQLTKEMQESLNHYKDLGYTIVILAINKQVVSVLSLSDTLREGIDVAIKSLRRYGIKKMILLSGDHQKSVDLVVRKLRLDEGIGHMLPEDKATYVKNLQASGHIVTFVGDGDRKSD